MPYAFDWAVLDEPSYNDFGHKETSDGKVVDGTYYVVLPDSRKQVVTYKADDYGYVADVKYEGEAKYDENKSALVSAYSKPVEATYPKPVEPAYSNPAYSAPAYPEPTYAKPAYPEPADSKPAPAYSAPAYTVPTYPKPAY